MDDYQKEIADLQAEVHRLVEAEGEPPEIAELEMQIKVLTALYEQARALHDQGHEDPDLRRLLRLRGYGDWTLDNVYAFVFESAVDLPDAEPRAFANDISRTDFAGILEAASR
jgi:predicted translin family RNA/ssDNA-binding protein